VLDVIDDEGLMRNAFQVGDYLRQRLRELSGRHSIIGDVRGAGLYIGVEMTRASDGSPQAQLATTIINALRDRQVLIGAAGRYGEILKLRPPLCFSAANADQLATALEDVLTKLTAAP
jgi:4-aminobutyrate aminotransferase-like enzyme